MKKTIEDESLKVTKCSLSEDGRHVKPCGGLLKACEVGNPRGKSKGIFVWRLYNFDKGMEPSRTMVGVKCSEYINGLIFNYCPFCGTNIEIKEAVVVVTK